MNNDTNPDTSSSIGFLDDADPATVKELLEEQLAARLADDPELVVVLNRDGSGLVLGDADMPLQTLLGVLSESVKGLAVRN